jgi:hypothetical protein
MGLILTGGKGAFSEPNENPHVSGSWSPAELETLLLERMLQRGGGRPLLFLPPRSADVGGFLGSEPRTELQTRQHKDSYKGEIGFLNGPHSSGSHRWHATSAQCSRVHPRGGIFAHPPPGICNLFGVGHEPCAISGSSDCGSGPFWSFRGPHNDWPQEICGQVRVCTPQSRSASAAPHFAAG